jgi:hypothetical protein
MSCLALVQQYIFLVRCARDEDCSSQGEDQELFPHHVTTHTPVWGRKLGREDRFRFHHAHERDRDKTRSLRGRRKKTWSASRRSLHRPVKGKTTDGVPLKDPLHRASNHGSPWSAVPWAGVWKGQGVGPAAPVTARAPITGAKGRARKPNSRRKCRTIPATPHATPPILVSLCLFSKVLLILLISPGPRQSPPSPPRRPKPSWRQSWLGLPQRAAYSECLHPWIQQPPISCSFFFAEFRVLESACSC